MVEIAGQKQLAGNLPPQTWVWVPDEPSTWWDRLKPYTTILWSMVAMRNGAFFRKWWALVKLAFDNWEPKETHKGIKVKKNLETFRKQLTIMAGHYDVVASLSGDGVKYEAKSISWAKMTEEEFNEFYERTKDAIWTYALPNYTAKDWERVTLELSRF